MNFEEWKNLTEKLKEAKLNADKMMIERGNKVYKRKKIITLESDEEYSFKKEEAEEDQRFCREMNYRMTGDQG